MVQEIVERLLIDIVLEVEIHGRTPHSQRDKQRECEQCHSIPRHTGEGVLNILAHTDGLAWRRLNTLLGREECNQEENKCYEGIYTYSNCPAVLQGVTIREVIDHRQREALNHKLCYRHHNKSYSCYAGALAYIAGHHTAKR